MPPLAAPRRRRLTRFEARQFFGGRRGCWSRTIALLAALGMAPVARSADVILFPGVVGVTPERVGYNSGHFMPQSNAAAWWKYSGVNAARVWATPDTVENNDDNGVWGDGVASQQAFIDRRSALRADPLNPAFINWPYLNDRYANVPTTGSNNVNLKYAFGELHAMGVEPVVEIHRTSARYPFDPAGTAAGWADRWEQWQHFYAQAFYLAQHFDVRRFQMYNEPNHSSTSISQAEYIERLRLASDAVQSAVADVNALFGKSLDVQMHAPVTAGGATLFDENPGGDPRDDATGWGELVMQNLHADYLGQPNPDFKLIDTYAYQFYSGNASTFLSNLSQLKSEVNAAAPGENIRFAITEMNVSTAANFEQTTETLDTPIRFAQLGSILSTMANGKADELYVFKFSQTADDSPSGVKKNGVHYVDNNSSPYNIGGVSKAGEVVRLFAKRFAGGRELLQQPVVTGTGASSFFVAASHDAAAGRYSLMSTNMSASQQTVNLNLSSLGVPVGAIVTVEEVSADRQGGVRHLLTVSETRRISFAQPGQSVVLVTAPQQAPAYRVTLGATDDASVMPAANFDVNFGASPDLFARNASTTAAAGNRSVAFMKFDLVGIATGSVEQAVLRVVGENDGTASEVITHVYGILADEWDEETITWRTAPNLLVSNGGASDISHNFIRGMGTSATILGHFTGTQTARELAIDVTEFVREHPDQKLSFLVAREVRRDGEDVSAALTSLKLASKEQGFDVGPQLLLSLNASALPADFNGDGVVDGADFASWQGGVGMVSGATRSNGDADGDGDVDGADYLAWQRSVGSSLPASSPAAAVPEPGGGALVLVTSLAVLGRGFRERRRSR
jgi:hypothetical protein